MERAARVAQEPCDVVQSSHVAHQAAASSPSNRPGLAIRPEHTVARVGRHDLPRPAGVEDGAPSTLDLDGATGAEEEIASLSAFEIGEGLEEEGEELSEEEAQLLSVEAPGFRALEEPQAASVGMTVVLVIAIVFVAVGAVSLFSFIGGHNPFPFLTDLFVQK